MNEKIEKAVREYQIAVAEHAECFKEYEKINKLSSEIHERRRAAARRMEDANYQMMKAIHGE
jgi:hypothetical protein